MLEYDFENRVGHWVCMTAHTYERAINDELMPHGITFRQCQILAWLALESELSQSELADRMRIEPPSLVPVLDRMERDGLLQRVPCPTDRRRKIVRPCKKATPVWKKIVTCAERVAERASQGLTKTQLATLKELLMVVSLNLSDGDKQRL